jgi:hypothetical protein
LGENGKGNAKNGGKWDWITKISSWKQVVATIVAVSITGIVPLIKPETAPFTTGVAGGLILLAFYIIRADYNVKLRLVRYSSPKDKHCHSFWTPVKDGKTFSQLLQRVQNTY